MPIATILYVALGGAIGSILRYLMQSWIGRIAGTEFPLATMLVNISGSVIMGVFIGCMAKFMPARAEDIRIFVAVGILGGYTTFSSFSLDAISLMERGQWGAMTGYVLASVLCSLIGLWAGLQLVRSFA